MAGGREKKKDLITNLPTLNSEEPFFFKFFKKGRKALLVLTLEFVFMTKINIITQPFNIISMLAPLSTLLFHKRSVQLGKIGRNLNHSEVILLSIYHARMNDIRLEIA